MLKCWIYLCSTNQLSMKIGYAKKVVLHNVWVFVMSAQQIWITLLLQFECHLKWHDKESFTHLFQLLYFEKHLKKKELLRVSLYFQSSPSDEIILCLLHLQFMFCLHAPFWLIVAHDWIICRQNFRNALFLGEFLLSECYVLIQN